MISAVPTFAHDFDSGRKIEIKTNFDSASCYDLAESIRQRLQAFDRSQNPVPTQFLVQNQDSENCRWIDTAHGSHEICNGYICDVTLISNEPMYHFISRSSDKYTGSDQQAQCESEVTNIESQPDVVSAVISSQGGIFSEDSCQVDSVQVEKN